jgi:hypothetical protein
LWCSRTTNPARTRHLRYSSSSSSRVSGRDARICRCHLRCASSIHGVPYTTNPIHTRHLRYSSSSSNRGESSSRISSARGRHASPAKRGQPTGIQSQTADSSTLDCHQRLRVSQNSTLVKTTRRRCNLKSNSVLRLSTATVEISSDYS